jgi:hypothetical protein
MEEGTALVSFVIQSHAEVDFQSLEAGVLGETPHPIFSVADFEEQVFATLLMMKLTRRRGAREGRSSWGFSG